MNFATPIDNYGTLFFALGSSVEDERQEVYVVGDEIDLIDAIYPSCLKFMPAAQVGKTHKLPLNTSIKKIPELLEWPAHGR